MMTLTIEVSAPADVDAIGLAAAVAPTLMNTLGQAGFVVHTFNTERDS